MQFTDLQAKVGETIGTSRWFEIGQERINAFADATEDHQFIHVDPEAARATPFGGTIAHGFLTLEPDTDVVYQIAPAYRPGHDAGVRWDDPAFGIAWPMAPVLISARDAGYPDFG